MDVTDYSYLDAAVRPEPPVAFEAEVFPASLETRLLASLRDFLLLAWFVPLVGMTCWIAFKSSWIPTVMCQLAVLWLWALTELYGSSTYGKYRHVSIRHLDGTAASFSAKLRRFAVRRVLLITVTVCYVAVAAGPPPDLLDWLPEPGRLIPFAIAGALAVSAVDLAFGVFGGLTLHDRVSGTTVFTDDDCRALEAGHRRSGLRNSPRAAFTVVERAARPAQDQVVH